MATRSPDYLIKLHQLYQEQKRLEHRLETLEQQIDQTEHKAAAQAAGFRVGETVVVVLATDQCTVSWSGALHPGWEAVVEEVNFAFNATGAESRRVSAVHSWGKGVVVQTNLCLRYPNGEAWFIHSATPKQLKTCLSKSAPSGGKEQDR